MDRQRGLTLIELVMTVAIAALALTLALPAFNGLQERTRAATARHMLTAALMTARSAAIMRREPVTACPTVDGIRCSGARDWSHGWILYHDPGRESQPRSASHVLRRFDALAPTLLVTSSVGRTLVRFLPDGRASGTNLSLRLCSRRNGDLLSSVIVSNTGRARVETPPSDTPCP